MITIKMANSRANQSGLHSVISEDGKWLIIQNLYFKEIGKTMIDENMVSEHAVNTIIAALKTKEE